MRILCIETSTPLASITVTSGDKLLGEAVFNTDRTLSARLLPEVERLLSSAGIGISDIDLFACSVGPGSFTGVRAGVATVQGLALTTDKPCIGISTLELLAGNFPMAANPVCTMLDARKNEVYAALFAPSGQAMQRLTEDCVMPPEAFLDKLCELSDKPVIFAGDGAIRYRELISSCMVDKAIFAPFPHNVMHAANAAPLALQRFQSGLAVDPAGLLPVYLRASEAEYAKLDRQKAMKG